MSSILLVENDLKEEELKQNWQGTMGPIFEDSIFDNRIKQNRNQELIEESGIPLEIQQENSSEVVEVKFYNHTGLEVRFTLSLLKIPL